MERDFQALTGLRDAIQDDDDRPGLRVKAKTWSKYADGEQDVPWWADAPQLSYELTEVLEQAARWRAIVETGRAIRSDE